MSLPPDFNTLLVISSPGGVPLYSARGLKQIIMPIGSQKGRVRRYINQVLIDLTPPNSRQYATEITCEDHEAPKLDGLWVGMAVTVDCVAELTFRTGVETPQRPEVSGSSRTIGDFTAYRPILNCLVTDFSSEMAEWERKVVWKLSLEERSLP